MSAPSAALPGSTASIVGSRADLAGGRYIVILPPSFDQNTTAGSADLSRTTATATTIVCSSRHHIRQISAAVGRDSHPMIWSTSGVMPSLAALIPMLPAGSGGGGGGQTDETTSAPPGGPPPMGRLVVTSTRVCQLWGGGGVAAWSPHPGSASGWSGAASAGSRRHPSSECQRPSRRSRPRLGAASTAARRPYEATPSVIGQTEWGC